MNKISVNFYIPIIMEAKQKWQIEFAAEIFHKIIFLVDKTLNDHPKNLKIDYEAIANDSYYCHDESILTLGITNESDKTFRKKCYMIIVLAIKTEEKKIAKLKGSQN